MCFGIPAGAAEEQCHYPAVVPGHKSAQDSHSHGHPQRQVFSRLLEPNLPYTFLYTVILEVFQVVFPMVAATSKASFSLEFV